MIGKPEWFTYRKMGWGIAPKTKEGYYYVLTFIALTIFIATLPLYTQVKQEVVTPITLTIIVIIIIDSLHIMTQMSKVHDERDNYHQLIIEKNVSFAALGAIIVLILYQGIKYSISVQAGNAPERIIPFDYDLAIVLATMLIAKITSSYYLKNR